MRYAVVSDIHANLQAWNSVLLDIREQDIDRIICLGDLVGYGPNPVEVLESVHANIDYFVLGNHDAVVCDKMRSDLFNDDAAKIINWTKGTLNKNAVSILKKIPLTLKGKNFRCSHSAFVAPGMFDYIFTEEDALKSFNTVEEQLLFCGHTHLPGIFVLGNSGTPHHLDAQDFRLEANKRYIVNVGSVGNPRAGAPVATYCIYDSTTEDIFWRNVHFDLYSYKQTLLEKGLPLKTSGFLEFDARIEHPPLREQISFSPPKNLSSKMKQTLDVEDIDQLKSKVRNWQLIAIGSLLTVFLLICLVLVFMHSLKIEKKIVGSYDFIPINSISSLYDKNLLPEFESATNKFTSNIQIIITSEEFQKYSFFKQSDINGIKFDSAKKDAKIQIIFPPFSNIRENTKFCLEGMFNKSDDFEGDLFLRVLIRRKGNDAYETLFTKPPNPNLIRKGGWIMAKRTFTIDEDVENMQCVLTGTFSGSVEVGKIELTKIRQ
ncbi:MAG: metallophosphoesterase family protein [Kiritimatiellae bacterium]|jgi:predicted phosphodiesterase|nr:metallophosphoesterase family protein [Kiritimatiellia bacterium]